MIQHLTSAASPRAETAVHDGSELRPVERIARRLASSVGLALGGWTLALYALTFLVVRQHYVEHPPHYDSISFFAGLFELLNNVQRNGFFHVLTTSFGSGLTWLQPAYALLLSWAPIRAPEWLVSLNFVLVLGAQAAIVRYGQELGFSRMRQVVAATLLVVPGALYPWDGGLQDLRRDVQLLLLALAILFLALVYVTTPTWQRGVLLGLLVGLAQWSRDNAAPIILIVVVPAAVLAIERSRRAGGVAFLARLIAVPLAVFLVVVLPYYAVTLASTLERYRSSVWGVGENRVESLLAFWNMPFNILLGGDRRINGRVRTALVTVALLGMALAATYALWRYRVVSVDHRRLREPAYAVLIASGAWVVMAVLLYNTLLLGYGARWHGVPFLPIIVGLVTMMIGLTGLVRRAPEAGSRLGPAIVGVGCLLLMLSAPLRMLLNQPPSPGADDIQAVRAATVEISERAGGRPVAFLAYDTLSRHHVRYYAALADRPGVTEFEGVANSGGDFIDLDQPIRSGDRPAELQQRLDRALRRWADFAVVYTDTLRYADPHETLWPYLLGQPVVDGLLADPGWRPVARFTLRERQLLLLENATARATRERSFEAAVLVEWGDR